MVKIYEASAKTVEEAIEKACMVAGVGIEDATIDVLELGGRGFLGIGQKDARVRVTVEETEPSTVKPAVFRAENRQKPAYTQSQADDKRSTFKNEPKQKIAEKKIDNNKVNNVIEPEINKYKHQKEQQETIIPIVDNYKRNESTKEINGERERHNELPEQAVIDEAIEITKAFLAEVFVKMNINPTMNFETKEGLLWLNFSGENLGSLIGRRGETLNSLQYLTNLVLNRKLSKHLHLVLDVEGYRKSREETLAGLAHKMADKAVRSGRQVELEPMNPHERRIVHIALQNDRRVDTTSKGEEPYRRVIISRRYYDKKTRVSEHQ